MKTCTVCHISKSLNEYEFYVGGKDGRRTRCKACDKEYQRQYHAKNAEKRRAQMKENYNANKSLYHKRSAEWKKENPDRIKPGLQKWRRENLAIVAALATKRRALRIQATPEWANEKAIRQYYVIANFLSVEWGIKFHVDHIVPLNSKSVCGLHVEANLSITLGSWNIAKGNRHWPDMPE